jgi:hypothetical protein
MNFLRAAFALLLLDLPATTRGEDKPVPGALALLCGFGGVEEAQDSSMNRSGLVIQMTMKSDSVNGKVVMKYKGELARVDMAENTDGAASMVIDLKKQNIAVLLHEQKMTMMTTFEAQRKLVQRLVKAGGVDLKKVAKPKPTGRKEKVGAWEAEIFETMAGKEKVRLWVVKDFPNYRSINARMAKFETDGSFDPNQFELGGLVVKSEFNVPPMGETSITLLRVREETVEDAEFKIPADYRDTDAGE